MTMPFPPAFARLFATSAFVQAADQIALAALPITAVLVLGAGPGLVGALVAAQTAAWLLVSLPAGVVADRLPKALVLRAALVVSLFAASAAVAAAMASSLALLAAAAFLAAAGTVTFVLVQIGLVPDLVPPGALPRANARIELARAVAAATAPFLVGQLASHVSPLAGYPLAALLALGALLCGWGLTIPKGQALARAQPMGEAVAEGGRFVFAQPLLRAIGLCAVFWNFAFVALLAIFVPFALSRLGTDAAGAGLALGLNGLGMILGAAVAPALFRRVPPAAILLFGPVSSVAGALILALAPAAGGLAAASLAFGLIGFGPMLWLVMQTSVRQIVTPPALMGRVTATLQVAIYGVRPLGALAGGLVGEAFGLDAAMAMVVAAFALSALVSVVSPLARLAALPGRAVEGPSCG